MNTQTVVKILVDAYNRKDWVAFAKLLNRDAVFESPDLRGGVDQHVGIESILRYLKDWTSIIPDDQASILNSELAEDGRLVCEVVWSGTHVGKPFEWQDITVPAVGNEFVNHGNTEYTVSNGKIAKIKDHFDASEFLAGFGIDSH